MFLTDYLKNELQGENPLTRNEDLVLSRLVVSKTDSRSINDSLFKIKELKFKSVINYLSL